MDQSDDKYRSSDDEDYDGNESNEDVDDVEEQAEAAQGAPKSLTGKRRRSARHDTLEAVDANEAADLKAAAREMYGDGFLADASGVHRSSSLDERRLNDLLAEMNAEGPRPRLTLVGGVPLARSSQHSSALNATAQSFANLVARGIVLPNQPRARSGLPHDRNAALQVRLFTDACVSKCHTVPRLQSNPHSLS